MNTQRIGITISASVGAFMTFMPWVKVPIAGTLNGTKGDGWITFGLFVIPILVAISGNTKRLLRTGSQLLAIVPSLLAVGIGMWEIADIKKLSSDFTSEYPLTLGNSITIEWGLYTLIIAGVVLMIFALTGKEKGSD